ncbi:hypothetical protein FA13DRAFT_1750252, partial [Coprinellus micaceus]
MSEFEFQWPGRGGYGGHGRGCRRVAGGGIGTFYFILSSFLHHASVHGIQGHHTVLRAFRISYSPLPAFTLYPSHPTLIRFVLLTSPSSATSYSFSTLVLSEPHIV